MLDFGKYTFPILMSYGIGIGLIGGLIYQSIIRQKKIRSQIKKLSKEDK